MGERDVGICKFWSLKDQICQVSVQCSSMVKKIIPTATKYRVYIVACQQGGVSSENHHNQPLNDARQKILARKWISLVYQPNDVDTAMDI